jgi:hypothetical protein
MTQHHQALPRPAPLSHGSGASLLAFLAILGVLILGLHMLIAAWLANLTVSEWRGAPAGAQLDVFFDEPAHPAWSW